MWAAFPNFWLHFLNLIHRSVEILQGLFDINIKIWARSYIFEILWIGFFVNLDLENTQLTCVWKKVFWKRLKKCQSFTDTKLNKQKRYRVFKKNFTHGISIISLVINMLEDWGISHLKGGINSYVWNTKIFLYDIREQRYKQNNLSYQIWRIWINEQSYSLQSAPTALYV